MSNNTPNRQSIKQYENYIRIKTQFVVQLLTEEMFRNELKAALDELKKAKGTANEEQKSKEITRILSQQGYSEELAKEIVASDLDMDKLKESNLTRIMPDDVELTTIGGMNLNW